MKGTKSELIKYRLDRAWDTLDDARILAEKEKGILQLIVYIMLLIMP